MDRMIRPQEIIDACDSTSGWTVLGNDTINLAAITTRRVSGTGSLEFDKTNGAANTIYAGIYKTIDRNLFKSSPLCPEDEIGWYCYLSALTNVAYAFIRLGTSASHCVEYRFDDSLLVAGIKNFCHVPLSNFYVTGNGCNFNAITYVAVGVAFDAETDALADISVDEIGIWPAEVAALRAIQVAADGMHTDLESIKTAVELIDNDVTNGTAYQDATGTPVVSPDTDVGTTPVALAVPTGAKYLYLLGTATIRFGSNATIDGTGTGKGYSIAPAYTWSPPIPVSDATAIYVRIDAASGTCSVHQMWAKQA